ncbi:MAG: prolipoprotein diacylglyceryl transferase [Gemmatimonadetes bacterium]|nr:MAG: prolipoprotein diacylglyceryl transferase [Gemmatimonadota bacterium]
MYPILFEVGALSIKSYGVMLALSFITGTYLSLQRAKQVGLNPDDIIDLILVILVSSIGGARMLFVATHFSYYYTAPIRILMVWEGGLILYGGIIGALLAGWWFVRRRNIPFLKAADTVIPAVALGIGITRIGCFLNGCCFGFSCDPDFVLGVTFPVGSPADIAGLSGKLYPTQLYSSVAGFVLFGVLSVADRKKRFEGFTLSLFLTLYALFRFIVEFYRYHDDAFFYHGQRVMTVSQLISLLLCFGGIGLGGYLYRKARS